MSSATLTSLLPLAIALPIVGAVLAPLLGRLASWLPLAVSVGAVAGAAVLLAPLAPTVYAGHVLVHHVGHWSPVDGAQLGVTLAADPLGLTFALLCALVGAVLLLYSLTELRALGKQEVGGYACLFQLLLAALMGAALTADMLNLFVWFEVAALASYGLTAFFLERPLAVEAGIKIMVLTNLASFLVFVAVALLYAGHGALNMGQLRMGLESGAGPADLVALGLLIAGFGTKAGLSPFHGWLPDAHTAAPGPVSALFSGLMVGLGVLGILRVVFDVYGSAASHAGPLLEVLGGLAAVIGALLALVQDDLKRLLAYDTVSQMGVLALAAGVGSGHALVGLVYHLVNHALFKAVLFLCAGAVVHATGMTKLSEMGGLARRRPLVTAAFLVGTLAIAGVPPLNGYVSLGLIHGSVEHGHPVTFAVLTLAQALTVAALARALYLEFFRRREDDYDRIERLSPGMLTAFGLLAGGCVLFGAAPTVILDRVIQPSAASLTSGAQYAAAVLGGGGPLTVPAADFSYLQPTQLGVLAGTLIVGLALAGWAVRRPAVADRPPLSWLRALHTGSVNDYAGYSALGILACITVLLLPVLVA